jgi:DNA primase
MKVYGTKVRTFDRRSTAYCVSNLDKLLYPGARFTKADVINYYINVFNTYSRT